MMVYQRYSSILIVEYSLTDKNFVMHLIHLGLIMFVLFVLKYQSYQVVSLLTLLNVIMVMIGLLSVLIMYLLQQQNLMKKQHLKVNFLMVKEMMMEIVSQKLIVLMLKLGKYHNKLKISFIRVISYLKRSKLVIYRFSKTCLNMLVR